MADAPKLKMYSIEKLVALGNSSQDAIAREKIKELITEKILMLHSPMFFLLNKFKVSDNILKRAYAKAILIRLKDDDIFIEDNVIDEILSLVSLEDLAIYGSEVISSQIRDKCTKLIWDNVVIFEDNLELDRKEACCRRRELVNKLR